ncbi:hypothetical protein [Micromonospora sp. DT31]|uniref:hypothetical protein n=1 Tax=Micromonospora sp. DT31 TaxID=3393434 RepID=UPI003CF66003
MSTPDLSYLLDHTSHVLRTRVAAALAEIGLTARMHCVPAHALPEERTQIQVAEMGDMDKTTMVVTVDALEEAGLVAVSLGGLVLGIYTVVTIERHGATSARTLGLGALAAALLVGFVLRQATARRPRRTRRRSGHCADQRLPPGVRDRRRTPRPRTTARAQAPALAG